MRLWQLWWHPPLAVRHSLISMSEHHELTISGVVTELQWWMFCQHPPSQACLFLSWYPLLQEHVKLPTELWQLCWQPPLLLLHSFTSGKGKHCCIWLLHWNISHDPVGLIPRPSEHQWDAFTTKPHFSLWIYSKLMHVISIICHDSLHCTHKL